MSALARYYPARPVNFEVTRRARAEWPTQRLIALAGAFDAGLSHELIAQALGLSKGAVSGKLDRLAALDPARWTRSATIIALKPDRSASAAKAEERRAQSAMARAIEESVVGVIMLDLEPHQCRWPMAFADEWTFCGCRKIDGSSYCSEHDARARIKVSR